MKKFCSIVLSIVALALLLTGCGPSVADEKKLQEDLSSYAAMSGLLNEGEEIKALEIEKRQTEKERRLDVVWCNVTTEDTECRYEKTAVLTYTLYDEGGWILENATVNDSAEWRISPLAGVTEDMIKSSVYETGVPIEGENWYASESSMKDFSITAHETDLEKRSDTVTVKFTIEDLVEQAAGEMTLNYTFDREWKLDSVTGNDGFTVSDIVGRELKVTDEDLIDVLLGLEYQYGGSRATTTFFSIKPQNISVDKSELSNFGIDNQESAERGALQTITCHATLTKPHAVFTITATIPYHYESSTGWTVQTPETALECVSVTDIQGEWKGSYRGLGNGTSVLDITSIDENGNIEATYTYTPSNSSFKPGSYKVAGELEFTTLQIHLVAGDWIVEPKQHGPFDKYDVSAILYVNDSIISGTANNENSFKVSK